MSVVGASVVVGAGVAVGLTLLSALYGAARAKIDELLALALLDARQYYKHAVTILVKQIQAKKPRQRVPVLYVLSALTTRADDPDAARPEGHLAGQAAEIRTGVRACSLGLVGSAPAHP